MDNRCFNRIVILAISFLCLSCDAFEYSPYVAPDLEESKKNLNLKNIERISAFSLPGKSDFCFAIISDSHVEYSLLEKVIRNINNDDDVAFVIHTGDMTDSGLYKEFHWVNEKMSGLEVPYIMIIGNHDYLSNGKLIYEEMFGPSSFTFEFNDTKFVCFDDVVWENDNQNPDFGWLRDNLVGSESYDHVFVLAHLPPYADQFDDYCTETYMEILESNKIRCSFHGHVHLYTLVQYEPGSAWYFTADALQSREYYKVYVSGSDFSVTRVSF